MSDNLKTRYLDIFRKVYANRLGEPLLIKLSKGREVKSLAGRLVPMPHLFTKPSWRTVIRKGIKLSLDISDMVDWYVYFDFKDPAIQFIESHIKEDHVVLDVGTNIGYVLLISAKKASRGMVYGFEPSSYNYKKCIDNCKLNRFANHHVFNFGLGRADETLYLETISASNHGMNRVTTGYMDSSEKIVVRKLDNLVKEAQIKRVDFIKIDVEGFEMNVLVGAEETISTFRPKIFLEVNNGFLSRYQSSSSRVFNWLRSKGYKIYNTQGLEIERAVHLNEHCDILAKPH
jgi:FkbM family methyltransferase